MKKLELVKNDEFSISNDDGSPQKLLFERLANKWFLMILGDLYIEELRFNAILKKHSELSQKMLSKTLKNLEEDGLITRNVNARKIPIQVTYKITSFGNSLFKIVIPLFNWSNENVGKVVKARNRYAKNKLAD